MAISKTMTSSFELRSSHFSCVNIIQRNEFVDARGKFSRLYCKDELSLHGWDKGVAQVNYSKSTNIGSIRGLHFQPPPYAEKKLITCLSGKVWDVFVDLRASSKTYLHWNSQILSEGNGISVLIPEGFAHGFQVLEEPTILVYAHSVNYEKKYESGINPLDPTIKIKWPLPITEISKRDSQLPSIDKDFEGIIC